MLRSYEEAAVLAQADYAQVLGTVIEVDCLIGYSRDDQCTWYFDPPIRVLVTETMDSDVVHTLDNFVDPYWDVKLVEELLKPEHRRDGDLPDDACSFYVDGTSYEFSKVTP